MISQILSQCRRVYVNTQIRRHGMINKRCYSSQPRNPMTSKDFSCLSVFERRSFSKLLFSYVILRACSRPLTFKYGQKFLGICSKFGLTVPVHWAIGKTFYKHFVAGETLNDVLKVAEALGRENIKTIVDYSVERCNSESWMVVDTLIESIRACHNNPNTPFACFKCTALASDQLLDRINKILSYYEEKVGKSEAWLELTQEGDYEQCFKRPFECGTSNTGGSAPSPLSQAEFKELELFVSKLKKLADASSKYDVPLLVDAEHSYYQKTIHFFSLYLMKRYSKEKPMIYNTYQMYLKEGVDVLKLHLQIAEREDLRFAAKIVRGGYIKSETKYSEENNTPYPVFTSIEQTAESYVTGIELVLKYMKEKQEHVGLVVATHNEDSIINVLRRIAEYDINLSNSSIYFAQLYGISDYISLALVQANYNVCKYVPFGPVSEVIPYLMRRVEENQAVLGNTNPEQTLLLKALKSRLTLSMMPLSNL